MKWFREHADVWTCGPFSICRQRDERSQLDIYELYSTTTYLKKFNTLDEAKEAAEAIGWHFELEVAS